MEPRKLLSLRNGINKVRVPLSLPSQRSGNAAHLYRTGEMRAVGKIASMTKMGRLDMKHIFLQYEGTSEIDHLIKVSAAKSDDLSSILVTHTQ